MAAVRRTAAATARRRRQMPRAGKQERSALLEAVKADLPALCPVAPTDAHRVRRDVAAARGRRVRRASHARPATRAARSTTSRTGGHATSSTRCMLRSTGSRPPASRPTPTRRRARRWPRRCRAVRTRLTLPTFDWHTQCMTSLGLPQHTHTPEGAPLIEQAARWLADRTEYSVSPPLGETCTQRRAALLHSALLPLAHALRHASSTI